MDFLSLSVPPPGTTIPKVAPANIEDALPDGSELQNYILEHAIGQGGFGITYRAKEKLTGRAVVIKENFPRNPKTRYVRRSAQDGATVVPCPMYEDFYEWSKKKLCKGGRHTHRPAPQSAQNALKRLGVPPPR